MENTAEKIANFFEKEPAELKDRLIIRAVNYKTHKKAIEDGDAIFKMVTTDIALVAYAVVSDDNNFMTMIIPKSWAEKLNFNSEKELFDFAAKNTAEKYPATVAAPDIEIEDNALLSETDFPKAPKNLMISCSNNNPNGATALFYPDVPKRLGKIMGDFVAICMNTMDVMIFRPGDSDIYAYRLIASTENNYGEMLSGKVIHFDSEGVMTGC